VSDLPPSFPPFLPPCPPDTEAAEKEEEEQEEMDADTSVYEAENTVVYQRVAEFRRRYRR
jgi:hypothetical protein